MIESEIISLFIQSPDLHPPIRIGIYHRQGRLFFRHQLMPDLTVLQKLRPNYSEGIRIFREVMSGESVGGGGSPIQNLLSLLLL